MRQEMIILVGIGVFSMIGVGAIVNAEMSSRTAPDPPSMCGDCRAASPGPLAASEDNSGAPSPGDASTSDSSAADVANETPSPTPEEATYQGKVDDLPDPAKNVLNFTPADSQDQTNSESIRDRVADDCGLGDYIGSSDYPGSVIVSPPREHGWVRVVWKPGKCGGIGGATYPNPTLKFEISEDFQHINYLGGMDSEAYFLTH
jgi:hypothetical protein